MAYEGYISAYAKSSQVGSTEANKPLRFPLKIIANNFPAQWALVRTDGGNLYVTNDAGTRIPGWVAWIDHAGGEGEMWFDADSFSALSDTEFRFHIDDLSVTAPAVGSTYGRDNVWNGTVDARSGFQETSGNFIDSSGNGNDGVPSVTSYGGATRIGTAQSIVRNTDDVDFPTSLDVSGASFIACWANVNTALSGQLQTIFDKQGLSSANDQFNLVYDRRTPGGLPDDRIRGQFDNQVIDFNPFAGTLGAGWHHFVLQYTGSQIELYIDGVSRGTNSNSFTLTANAFNLRVGQSANHSTFGLDGDVDEFWFKDGASLSSGFIETMYNNQTGDGTAFWDNVTWNPDAVAFVPRMFFMS